MSTGDINNTSIAALGQAIQEQVDLARRQAALDECLRDLEQERIQLLRKIDGKSTERNKALHLILDVLNNVSESHDLLINATEAVFVPHVRANEESTTMILVSLQTIFVLLAEVLGTERGGRAVKLHTDLVAELERTRLNSYEKQLEAHVRRLDKLKEQRASFGIDTTPQVLTEIETLELQVIELSEKIRVARTSA